MWKIVISNSRMHKGAATITLSDSTVCTRTYASTPEEVSALCDGIGIALRALGQEYERVNE